MGAASKLVVCGAEGVGKTCLVTRLADGIFPLDADRSLAVGCPFRAVTIPTRRGSHLKLSVYEAPESKFKMHARTAAGIIFLYDLTDPTTVEVVSRLIHTYRACHHRED
jgi:GTPase SAR1 family protein